VQYRDLFDNHMPLFHLLFAPIFGLIGDRATHSVSNALHSAAALFCRGVVHLQMLLSLFSDEPAYGL